jgi:2-polyprenyl-3-methyl-5-hydroxy-6-metoxy-1,4-benzoquinol methylase
MRTRSISQLSWQYFLRIMRRVAIFLHREADALESWTNEGLDSFPRLSSSNIGQKEQIIESTSYSMLTSESEDYYAEQYWAQLLPILPAGDLVSSVLDLGCGQGRMSLRFANHYGDATVTGVDISEAALIEARRAAASEKLSNLTFSCKEIFEELDQTQPESIDIVVMTEVAFYHPNWITEFPKIVTKLKHGGLFIGSFRSTYFNVLLLLKEKRISDARRILHSNSGELKSNSGLEFSWGHSDEIRELIGTQGLDTLVLSAVGTCSGVPGDPHAGIVRPGLLDISDREILMEIEMSLNMRLPDAGRYILVVAQRS